MNRLENLAWPKKLLIPFTDEGGSNFSIASIFALSTYIPLAEI